MNKAEQYATAAAHIKALIAEESDLIAAMSTVVCELHNGLEHFDWTGFYRVSGPGLLKVGPYQGGHGCLSIPFEKGVCGKCAREGQTQLIPDVRVIPFHIACASSTLSEIVVPVFDSRGEVRAVLDVDSNSLAAFDEIDARNIEEICRWLTPLYGLLGCQ
jgi:L-methionine (R)-S-oxide reductase